MSPGTARSASCIVLFRLPLYLEASWTDSDGRFSCLDYSFPAARFRVACIYAPNLNRKRNLFLALVTDNLDPGKMVGRWQKQDKESNHLLFLPEVPPSLSVS